ncbi:beta-lactam-binding protein with PASTA domain [Wenyingzhuangia heitensis]|uniref:Beta-lactam-binding protein with PASTA domain n=1 Tax=Wenyingzhuangia heitensis TaxID=1487859 RepID=A0ABX0UB20_9FLAO|nr:PASTA domain-containing protein [Wenyingzhuangia heitensis]NIJ44766.1 beta-lactam-binding protein with PASTA domain [Wenyingzhuangia heitensis]
MKLLKFLKSKTFLINLLISLIISVLLIVGVVKSLHSITNQDQKIVVPDLTALNLDEVKIVLEDLSLDYAVLESGSYNPEIPKEAVLEQEPQVGAIVKEKRKIYVTINPDGYAQAPIPPFYGKTKKEIVQLIINSGFNVGMYEEVDDIGTVIRGLKFKGQDLEAGDMLPKMSTIDVVIGNGQLR